MTSAIEADAFRLARQAGALRRGLLGGTGDRVLSATELDDLVATLDELAVAAGELGEEHRALRRELASLHRERLHYRDLFEWAAPGYVVADDRGVIREVNRAACLLLADDSAHLVGAPLADFVAEEDRRGFVEIVTRARRQARSRSWEARMVPRAGDPFRASIELSVRAAGTWRQPSLRFLVRDVTVAHREAAALHRAVEDHERAEAAQRVFLVAAAHDLRTPVNGILAAVQSVKSRVPDADPELARALGVIDANAEAVCRMQDQLIDLERFAQGGVRPHVRHVDVTATVEAAVKAARLGDRSLELDLEAVEAEIDPGLLEAIARNLLENVARHTPPLTRAWVRLSRTDEGILLVVEDDGPGVPESGREAVFELFTSFDEAGDRSGGIGAGLYLVRRFAEIHGGAARVEERAGGGASFRVLLREPR